ncbi:MAG: filamentous hemagglutinin N-terminal domain-containing protein [Vampirovibrionales bacterium]|nr:filamentous hemagglutinin N-terminal domain-containing protein [Vampirovibrionales bacterium]
MTESRHVQRTRAAVRYAASLLTALTLAAPAAALPSGWQVESGDVSFDVVNGNTLNVTSHQAHAIINWQQFNIAQGETVNFLLSNNLASILNRISGGASVINGALSSNGTVILSNPAGLTFGNTANVNVGNLIATTLHLSSADYLAQNWTFSRPDGVGAGLIDNRGDITTQPGGFVVLAGGAIKNSGNIYAPEGRIALAAGDVVRMQVSPTQSVEVTIDESVKAQIDGLQSAIDNSGTLSAQEIRLKAKLIEALYARTINHTGVMTASTAKIGESGTIQLRAEGADASIVVGESGELTANGAGSGNGGAITLLADAHTQFDGLAEAKGGEISGNGGFIETSGTQTLRIGQTARVNASATNGAAGEWLMDPTDMTIHAGAGADDASNVYANNIQATLNTGTSVTVQTAAAGGAAGNLTVMQDTSIAKTSGGDATLTLKAHNSILMDGAAGHGISITSSSGKLNLVLNSDTDQGADAGAGGAVRLNYANINTNGGNITIGGGADPTTQAARGTASNDDGVGLFHFSILNAGAGHISIRGEGRALTPWHSTILGVYVGGGSEIRTTSGHITLTGQGGAGQYYNHGVMMEDPGSLIQSDSGAITVQGQGGNGSWDESHGVYISNGARIESLSSAPIEVTGTGGAGRNLNIGVFLYQTNARITGVNGAITVHGVGGAGWGSFNDGVVVYTDSGIVSTGTGAISVLGEGGSGVSNNYGTLIEFSNARITGHAGNISVTGRGGSGSGNDHHGLLIFDDGAITSDGAANITLTAVKGANASVGFVTSNGVNIVGGNAMTGTISIVSDSFNASSLAIRNHGGAVHIAPYTPGASIGINGGAGTVQLSNALLNMIDTSVASPASVTLGDASSGTGLVTIGNNWALGGYNFDVRAAGGAITAGDIASGAHDITLMARSGDVTLNGNLTGDAVTVSASGSILDGNGAGANITASSASLNAGGIIGAAGDPLDVAVSGVLTARANGSQNGYAIRLDGSAGSLDVLLPSSGGSSAGGYYWEGLASAGQPVSTPSATGNVLFNGNTLGSIRLASAPAPELGFLMTDKLTPIASVVAPGGLFSDLGPAPPDFGPVIEIGADGPLATAPEQISSERRP